MFVILQMDVSTASAMIVAGVGAYLIKCYFWCHVINSFQDIVRIEIPCKVVVMHVNKAPFNFRTIQLSSTS